VSNRNALVAMQSEICCSNSNLLYFSTSVKPLFLIQLIDRGFTLKIHHVRGS
jgi:hypothetical protein